MPLPDALSRWIAEMPSPRGWILLAALLAAGFTSCVSPRGPKVFPEVSPGICYTNQRESRIPWSIHVVRVDRAQPDLELRSVHAHGASLGLSTVGEMIDNQDLEAGTPVVAVNGDFFQMPGKAHAGDPRGLQIMDGEMISAPSGGVSFWIDPTGEPHTMNVTSLFKVFWPDGSTNLLGLNETRKTNGVVLYTPGAGWSTLSRNSRELVLEREGDGAWFPLRAGDLITARVKEVRETGNTPLAPNQMILSAHRRWSPKVPKVAPGALLKLSLETSPDLRDVRTALSGGPVLVRNFEVQNWPKAEKDPKGKAPPPEIRTMWEKHPRTAIGWNNRFLYLVEVDGRQAHLSIGMTLKELAEYMVSLGCREALNLDGGGSSTLWLGDGVVNSPSDDEERPVANALIVVRKKSSTPAKLKE